MAPNEVCSTDQLQRLEASFGEAFGDALVAEGVASAPGRVNLIGEHTDYNSGFVLPIAIHRHVHAAFRRRDDRRVRVAAWNLGEACEFALDAIVPDTERRWSNYLRGVALELGRAGFRLAGVDMAVGGDLPIAAGVSSSAALELATAQALLTAAQASMPLPEEGLLCRRAENEFVGVGCGVMDQYICGLGREGHAMLLDCLSLTYDMVPLPPEAVFVVCDTRKARELGSSAYNERRRQCEEGALRLGVNSLRQADLAGLEETRRTMDGVVWRRCRHVVTEIARTLEAAERLRAGDLERLGQLMDASHASLRDDYEVSCPELEAMVSAAREAPGCRGARLTGAGFGGCAVALVQPAAVEEFAKQTHAEYEARTGRTPVIYPARASNGVCVGRPAR